MSHRLHQRLELFINSLTYRHPKLTRILSSLQPSAHILELSNPHPTRPFFFLKPSSAILPPGSGPVLRPRGTTLHHEVELALIIGRSLRDLSPTATDEALDAIAGYAVGIDMTARNMQDRAKRKGMPWTTAKGFDTFLPIRWVLIQLVTPAMGVENWSSGEGLTSQMADGRMRAC